MFDKSNTWTTKDKSIHILISHQGYFTMFPWVWGAKTAYTTGEFPSDLSDKHAVGNTNIHRKSKDSQLHVYISPS